MVPKTLKELYDISAAKFPEDSKQQRVFRNKMYRLLPDSVKRDVYLEDMLDPYNPTYEQYMDAGWTPEQYEFFVKNSPNSQMYWEDAYGLYSYS